jgi:DNA-binding NarL/FixJ family response regulator
MASDDMAPVPGQGSLSDRELQIVELVASGLTNQEISEKLEISKRTVDNHISNI